MSAQSEVASYVEHTMIIASERTDSISALFRAIADLSSDTVIQKLCRHGALQADLASEELVCLREDAEKQFPDQQKEGSK